MSTKVTMPQMGESIAEGTITKWLKKVGDKVERDEPLFEISTDKVDSVIPAPASGTLISIAVQEGQTVEINTTVGMIGEAGETAAAAPAAAAASAPAAAPAAAKAAAGAPAAPATPAATATAVAAPPAPAAPARSAGPVTQKRDDQGRTLTSPLVRNIAKAQGVDLSQVPGTGFQNRVTKDDIENFLKGTPAPAGAPARPAGAPGAGAPAPAAAPAYAPQPQMAAAGTGPMAYSFLEHAPVPIAGDVYEGMNNVQKKMANHMWQAKQLIPHVTTVFEFDMSRVVAVRAKEKNRFEAETGTKLTYMPFYCRAVVEALKLMPLMNCSISGDQIVYHKTINLGIAVALDWGLIVPVIKNAEEKSFLGLARAVSDLAGRARSKQLKPDDIQGGTFTITNPGVFGSLFGTPIISPPQVGILDLGAIQKRPVVVESESGDSIAVRSMQYVATAFDHRILGGAEADKFMNILKDRLEHWDESIY